MKEIKLLTGLGPNKNIILELIDFFNGGEKFRYGEEGEKVRQRFKGSRLTELHLVCTAKPEVKDTLAELKETVKDEYSELADGIRAIELDCGDIGCSADDKDMRQKVYQEVRALAADNLVIFSGGRKTVTNRLIEAGLLYGCMGYLTITARNENDPLVRHHTEDFNVLWLPARRFSEERRKGLESAEIGDNFRSLYLLPTMVIQRLRDEKIGQNPDHKDQEKDWLHKLPKADLHCHLGGAFEPSLLKEMAGGLLVDLGIDEKRKSRIRERLETQLSFTAAGLSAQRLWDLEQALGNKGDTQPVHCLQILEKALSGKEDKHIELAVLIEALSLEQIEEISWDRPAALADDRCLSWYMACGNLGGSALLQTENNLRRCLRWLLEKSWQENVSYLEVRFSPDNYTRAGLTIPRVISALFKEAENFMETCSGFKVNFLIMATRHKEKAAMMAHVAAAVTYARSDSKGPRISGFDLAGQEEDHDPVKFQDIFMPLHHHFINITIHAGEMAEEDRIWQALYLLHAKRIGHGLELVENKKMMGYVRDYGIAIEMCPLSNRLTKGFRRFDSRDSGPVYPLRKYMKAGISVTVNTDNRGISRTDLSGEFLEAARLTEGGLSKWEVLKLIKNSFKVAFIPKNEKDQLLKETDRRVFELMLDEFQPE